MNIYRKFNNFVRGLSVNRTGLIGVILTTSAFVCFIFFEMLRMVGVLTNAYIGLIIYLLFPFLFFVGLILIPFGWNRYRKSMNMTTRELLNRRFDKDDLEARPLGSRIFLTILFFTIINIIFISAAGFRTLKFMDEPVFCGTACHKVMSPEWTTYRLSPHARVKCVECHVGEGMEALINSKLSGLRQMIKALLDTYERPIPTPVYQLRPARETCEKCHWPEKFYGTRLKIITHYNQDEASTLRYVTLNLKIDTGKEANKSGIHWHISKENRVRYISVNDEREEILMVEVRQKDKGYKRYTNKIYKDFSQEKSSFRVMDCVDCHNRVTHIYEEPESAVDQRLSKKKIPLSLPYIKREILAAITMDYNNEKAALKGIAHHLYGFYRNNYPDKAAAELSSIDTAINVAREIYQRNIHHIMKIDWNTYPSFKGHKNNSGCFRCHNENIQDSEGNILSYDCTLCHSILSFDERGAFDYLNPPQKKSPNYKMHKFLREEFFKSQSIK